MAETTGIEWSNATWNPWTGCHKASTGCNNCYMHRDLEQKEVWNPDVVRRTISTFDNPLKWQRALRRVEDGGHAPKAFVPRGGKIFTCSYSDFFIEEADEWRAEAWEIIRDTPEFTYIILTKRPQNISDRLPKDWGDGYQNVWILVSCENQKYLDRRWGILKTIPAVVRGISAEPLLGALDLTGVDADWIITGGESGFKDQKIRPANVEWFRQIRDYCKRYGIPYFHKQNGGFKKIAKHWGGNEIDGRCYQEFPKARSRKSVMKSSRADVKKPALETTVAESLLRIGAELESVTNRYKQLIALVVKGGERYAD